MLINPDTNLLIELILDGKDLGGAILELSLNFELKIYTLFRFVKFGLESIDLIELGELRDLRLL